MHTLKVLVLVGLGLAQALFSDQAGAIDWHNGLLGLPAAAEVCGSKETSPVLYLSEKSNLALISPDGQIVWRQNCKASTLSVSTDFKNAFTLDGASLSVWDTATGALQFSAPALSAVWTTTPGVLVLANESEVKAYSLDYKSYLWTSHHSSDVVEVSCLDSDVKVGSTQCFHISNGDSRPCGDDPITLEAPKPLNLSLGAGLALRTSDNGTVQLEGSSLKWKRNEALAYIETAVLFNPQSHTDSDSMQLSSESWPGRLSRHFYEAFSLGGLRKLVSVFWGSKSSAVGHWHLLGLENTLFVIYSGLTKTIYALDVKTGAVKWTKLVGKLPLLSISNGVLHVYTDAELCLDSDGVTINCPPVSTDNEVEIDILDGILVGSGWQLDPGAEWAIVTYTTAPRDELIASVGEVLPDKKVRYKYLNPELLAAVHFNAVHNELLITLLDAANGRVLHTSSQKYNGDINLSEIQLVLSENWLVYTAPNPELGGTTRIGVMELYESSQPNQRLSENGFPTIYEENLVFPRQVSALAVTKSRFGIIGRNIVLATKLGQVWSIPKQVIRPRILTRATFNPVIDIPAQFGCVSRNLRLGSIAEVHSAATDLESTVIVCVNGDDLFCTLTMPSGELDTLSPNFGHGKLIVLVCALLYALFYFKATSSEKRADAQWR